MSETTEARVAPPGFFESLAERALSPGWAKREPAMWPTPRPTYVPAVWRYADALAALTQATAFVDPQFAERRNLIMVNPIAENHYPTCRHLVAAYQLVLPGETARSHRHTPNALRLVLDAKPGACTLVDGMLIEMAPGDVVLTPQWRWHGHDNQSDALAFWIDFLDVPLVQNMENMFFEHHPQRLESARGRDPDSPLRYKAADILPRAREERSVRIGAEHLATIGLHMIALRRGERHEHEPRMDNNIYAVTSGEVSFSVERLGNVTLSRGDVIVVPSWYGFSIEGGSNGAAMLRVTDEPAFVALGFDKFRREGMHGGGA